MNDFEELNIDSDEKQFGEDEKYKTDELKKQILDNLSKGNFNINISSSEMPLNKELNNIEKEINILPDEIGKVMDIKGDILTVRITSSLAFKKNLIDQYVSFSNENNDKLVGVVTNVNSETINVRLIGEIKNNIFIPGVLVKPNMNAVCFIVSDNETKLIVTDDKDDKIEKKVLLGTMPLYNNSPAYIPTNAFFSNHFSIFGNTGSGKSCGVSRIFQNAFFNQMPAPVNACVFIFDVYGEYESALSIQNSSIIFKRYTTNVKEKENLIKIPLWLLDIDDYALLLDVDDPNQLPIIEKALRLVTVFSGNDSQTRIYKNDIIAKAILEVLYSGGSPSEIHDQIFAILTSFNTPDLNLESPVVQPGYTRSLRQCLIIDKEGKINEIQLVTEYIKNFINYNLKLELPDGTIPYTLQNLKEAFDFALISEGILKSDKMYDKANTLKVRLDSLLKSEYSKYFDMDKYINQAEFIKSLITNYNGQRAQIININISYLDNRLSKTICKIYSKILFDFTSKLEKRGSFPVHIILEEAHRYVQNDSDIKVLGYNIFDRIAKEGRKYGVMLGMISQRPSELSETALSQCSNFLIFKMQHPQDVSFIRQMVPHVTDEIVEKMKELQPGTCIAFGSAFKLPIIVKLEMPNPSPTSQNVDILRLWY